jgi:hypothetical protein
MSITSYLAKMEARIDKAWKKPAKKKKLKGIKGGKKK